MDIKESKEYRLAKDWEMAVNSFSFNPERFAAAIPDMHPTLQQSLYRLIKACIKVMADETRRYDDRNRASHEEAKHIMEYLNEHGKKCTINIKNDDMKTTKIQFNGRSYYSRIVESVDGEELLIGSTILLDALQPGSFNDENEGFASKEAERIYDEIFFFTDERTLQLPENELIAELKKDNPDWFE